MKKFLNKKSIIHLEENEKEVGIYLSVGALVVLGIFIAYLLNVSLTGFVIFQQQSQSDFDQGVYANTSYNGTAVALGANQTSGTYTSKVFDSGSSATWNNLTWQGNGALTFEVRGCASANCSTESFVSGSLNALNITSQYFQYRATFSDPNASLGLALTNVALDYSVIVVPVTQTAATISQPAGVKSSNSGIAVNFSAQGASLACSYTVLDATDLATIQSSTNLPGCANTTFNLGAGEGSYTLRLAVTGSNGSVTKDSNFSIDLPSAQPATEPEAPVEAPLVPVVPVAPVVVTPAIQLTAPEITASSMHPGEVQTIKWSVQNSGTDPLSACVMKAEGDFASWITASDASVNLNAGASNEYSFTITVPTNAAEGSPTLGVSAECAETAVSKTFTLAVIQKRLDINVSDVQRISASKIRVIYTLSELSGKNQAVELTFKLLDGASNVITNASQNKSMNANQTKEFTVTLPVNVSLNQTINGTYTLKTDFNSNVSTNSITSTFVLGAPSGGFLSGLAIFDGLGNGGSVVVVIVVLALGVLLFVARSMRKSGKSLLSALSESDK